MKFRVERDALADAVAWTAKSSPFRARKTAISIPSTRYDRPSPRGMRSSGPRLRPAVGGAGGKGASSSVVESVIVLPNARCGHH